MSMIQEDHDSNKEYALIAIGGTGRISLKHAESMFPMSSEA